MSPDSSASHRDRLAPRTLTLLYLGFAYLCLGTAFAVLAVTPQTIGGFFYHPRMLAVVHLVTLGWISSSIVGSFYLVGPIALRTVMRARRADYVAWGLVVVGVSGLVSHFWIDEYSGMVWSAGTLWLGFAYVAARGIGTVARAKVQGGVKLHIILAFVNILAAGILGILIGFEKQLIHVLPGYMLHSVYAHAHLAVLGWATMMVMGVGLRLFPMVLPSAMPTGLRTWASAVLVEGGLVVLLVGLPASSVTAIRGGALLVVAGLAVFLAQVAWMRRHPKPAPKELQQPDFGTWHALQAVGYLIVATLIGVALAFSPPGAWKVRAAMAYGVFALIGFLAQIVIGIAARILPTFAWMHFYVRGDFKVLPPSQYTMHLRGVQMLGFGMWTVGVPVLAWGLSFDHWALVSGAATMLLLGLICNAVNGVRIARHAFMDTGEKEAADRASDT